MEEKYQAQTEQGRPLNADEEIDLIELARKLWASRRLILKCCAVAAFAGIVVGYSIPKEYTSKAVLSPEATGMQGMSGSIGQLAGMMGFNVGNSSKDAVYPMLYPDVVTSVPFLTDLFPVEVTDRKGELTTTLYDYMDNHQRSPWWSAVISAPFRAVGWFFSLFREQTDDDENVEIDTFRLTRDQTRIAKAISDSIAISVDKKTMIVSLSVTMQDPVVSAIVANAVIDNLKSYITAYRTSKARHDLEFTEKLYEENKANYEAAQSRYAEYVDRNQNIVLHRVRIEQERLQNEMSLKYSVYNQTAQQLQIAKAKVQESTPVYAVVRPVTVPLKPTKPSKMMILIGFVFLAFLGSSAWILFGRDFVARLKSDETAGE